MRYRLAIACLALAFPLLTAAAGDQRGCGSGLDNRPGEPGIDVGGVAGADWDVSYGTDLTVIVKSGGVVVATQTYATGVGGPIDIDGIQVDLKAMCERGDVTCPQDVFPNQVTMTQPGADMHLLAVTFNPKGALSDYEKATLLGNVDSDHDFSIALGVGAAAAGVCGLLSVSYATGSITSSSTNAAGVPIGTNLSGEIVTGLAGGCAVLGQGGNAGAAAGITVELRLPFTAVRR
ncbi:MAG: hypothetical protein KC503_08475 [Myxococcales bacterium]|nr:hypothetical protein [Myxococcales bacterium]